ncbi:zinc metalloprotease HtpX [Candidatus Woesearchaeota archaeon]|nr:zinc metalloprotease HtpX [Candidatus Woesearchaeota archaeon]
MNRLKTFVLLATLSALLLGVGQLLGGYSGLIFAGVFVLVMNFGSYFFSDKVVLKMYRAKPASQTEHPQLFKAVREVVHLAGIEMPKVYVIPSANPNAFATGRNPKHSAIAVTTGIIDLLSYSELKGVIAHEISHIKNRDVLIQTIAATIAGVISYVAFMARWAAIFGGFGSGRDDDGGGLIGLLVLAIVTPLIATILQLAISRSREYLADESAAKTLHEPYGLASALQKLKTGVVRNPMRFGSPATSALFIANPFRDKGMLHWFSTHPPLDERIKKLHNMKI